MALRLARQEEDWDETKNKQSQQVRTLKDKVKVLETEKDRALKDKDSLLDEVSS